MNFEIFKMKLLGLFGTFLGVFELSGVQVKVRINFLKILFFHFDIELHWSLIFRGINYDIKVMYVIILANDP